MKSNEQLRRDVVHELTFEPKLDERHVSVSVKDGAVTLGGHVPTYVQKVSAVRAAERVYGVKAVADELEIQLEGSMSEPTAISQSRSRTS